jgi:predicted MFS family arabinose efflux permease
MNNPAGSSASSSQIELSSGRERAILWLMAGLQFTHILDFMVMSPLGPQFMRLWGISAQQVGLLVSVYAFTAFGAALIAAFFIDRFDRRQALLLVFSGFVLATIACALAPGYHSFLAARALAGAFGGVVGSIVMSIVGDVIPAERRGRAMGVVMSAFPVVAVVGVPMSLWLAAHFSWHAPFVAVAAVSALLWVAIVMVVPPVRAHLGNAQAHAGVLRDFIDLFKVRNQRISLAAMFLGTMSGFMVFPFLSAYQVKNIGITEHDLATVYLAGGLATIFTSRLVGFLADRYGKRRMFVILAVLSIVPVLVVTHLPPVSLVVLLLVTTPFMVLVSGRFIPLMALVTTSVNPATRGNFMSLSSAAQNLASGTAAVVAGLVLGQTASGALTHFGWVGIASSVLILLCAALSLKLRPMLEETPPTAMARDVVSGVGRRS